MTEVAIRQSDDLSLVQGQTYWSDQQLAVLRHMGVENAPEGDLRVFHHVCTRTGLDPFARQIYMIARKVSKQVNGEWVKDTKYTIQTGIDGFRLIGRRAADAKGHKVSVSEPLWAHEDGSWRPVWRKAWGLPVAAKVTIHRDGEPFTAVALFEEYAQTKYGGDLTAMWQQRPAGQIAKCAEALAWRLAFPQDLSGLYADEEMGQADRVEPERAPIPVSGADRMRAALGVTPNPGPEPADVSEATVMLDTSSGLAKAMFAALGAFGVTDKADRLAYVSDVVGREIVTSRDMTEDDARAVLAALDADRKADPVTEHDPTVEPGWQA